MDKTNSLVKINIGCGSTPIEGWFNYDNSFSIRLSKQPILYNILGSMGFISKAQREYINFLNCLLNKTQIALCQGGKVKSRFIFKKFIKSNFLIF